MPNEKLEEEPEPLKIKCSSTDCKNDKHYFGPDGRKDRRKKSTSSQKDGPTEAADDGHEHCLQFQPGECRECGATPVVWTRLHQRDIADIVYIIASLKYGCWQHHWWEKTINPQVVQETKNKGLTEIRQIAKKRLRDEVCPAKIFRDSTQTPREHENPYHILNIIFHAQHATATCCRKCLSYWHGIAPGHEMSALETEYCVSLIDAYICERIPALTEEGANLCLPL